MMNTVSSPAWRCEKPESIEGIDIECLADYRDHAVDQQRERIVATSFSMPVATSFIPGPSI